MKEEGRENIMGNPDQSSEKSNITPFHYLLIALIFGFMGAFFWAIRGTSGFGGSQGGLLAGVGWGILWYVFSRLDGRGRQRPYGTDAMLAAITFGIAYGGMTGYGVYIRWIQGSFYLNLPEGSRPIGAWTGYAMLFICGLHWGGVPGAFMAWCAPRKPLNHTNWAIRVGAGFLGAFLASAVVRLFPDWFLPFYDEGIYEVAEYRTAQRALGSIRNIAPHVGFFLGFLAYEIGRKDWRAVGMILIMAFGFAIPFTIGGYWHTFHGSEVHIDWWKNWEMTIGFGGGLAFGLAFYLFNRPDPSFGPRKPTVNVRIWGGAFPVWFTSCFIFMNGYRGFVNIHDLDWPGWIRIVISVIYVLPATYVFALWIRRIRRDPDGSPLPVKALGGVLALIVVVGFIVSWHVPLELYNKVLLVSYTIFVLVSAALFGLLWKGLRTGTD